MPGISLKINGRFERTCHLQLQRRIISEAINRHEPGRKQIPEGRSNMLLRNVRLFPTNHVELFTIRYNPLTLCDSLKSFIPPVFAFCLTFSPSWAPLFQLIMQLLPDTGSYTVSSEACETIVFICPAGSSLPSGYSRPRSIHSQGQTLWTGVR